MLVLRAPGVFHHFPGGEALCAGRCLVCRAAQHEAPVRLLGTRLLLLPAEALCPHGQQQQPANLVKRTAAAAVAGWCCPGSVWGVVWALCGCGADATGETLNTLKRARVWYVGCVALAVQPAPESPAAATACCQSWCFPCIGWATHKAASAVTVTAAAATAEVHPVPALL